MRAGHHHNPAITATSAPPGVYLRVTCRRGHHPGAEGQPCTLGQAVTQTSWPAPPELLKQHRIREPHCQGCLSAKRTRHRKRLGKVCVSGPSGCPQVCLCYRQKASIASLPTGRQNCVMILYEWLTHSRRFVAFGIQCGTRGIMTLLYICNLQP